MGGGWNKGLTKETDKRVANNSRNHSENMKKAWNRGAYKDRITRPKDQWGEKNHMWKGDKAGYQAIHCWIRKRYGKAKVCEKCSSIRNVDWANISKEYTRERKDWIHLCRSCHFKYDKVNVPPIV